LLISMRRCSCSGWTILGVLPERVNGYHKTARNLLLAEGPWSRLWVWAEGGMFWNPLISPIVPSNPIFSQTGIWRCIASLSLASGWLSMEAQGSRYARRERHLEVEKVARDKGRTELWFTIHEV
jgi:hypothetical protein